MEMPSKNYFQMGSGRSLARGVKIPDRFLVELNRKGDWRERNRWAKETLPYQ